MTTSFGTGAHRARREPFGAAQWLSVMTGVAFVAIGIAGFAVTGVEDFFGHGRGEVLGFDLNGLHNVVHLVFGVLGLVLAVSTRGAVAYGLVVGIGYLGALVYGMVARGRDWDVLAIDTADNWLHLTLSLVGFAITAVGLGELRDLARPRSRPQDRSRHA